MGSMRDPLPPCRPCISPAAAWHGGCACSGTNSQTLDAEGPSRADTLGHEQQAPGYQKVACNQMQLQANLKSRNYSNSNPGALQEKQVNTGSQATP